jgi:predicted Rossmann fold flavoprotein
MTSDFDVAIIGAGAAGMMCAIEAGRRRRKVVVLDHNKSVGRKILISGGGRCNFTNLHTSPSAFVSANPHFAKSALAAYTPYDFIALVEKHGIRYHEKKLGQLFCDDSAQRIISMLTQECADGNAQFKLDCQVKEVCKTDKFTIRTNQELIRADCLVVASGGLSIPQIGATGFGYQLAKQFGLPIVDPFPALDGFQLSKENLLSFQELSGISVDCLVSCAKASFRENILFTHQGLSGPASLQASLYWQRNTPITINLLPDLDIADWLTKIKQASGKTEVRNCLSEVLPRRLAARLCDSYGFSGAIAQLSDRTLNQLNRLLEAWQLFPEGTIGYKKAEVTRGGVDTRALSSKTMESKNVPGLFFIGEVVDVTGQLGGYNFQWAWSSGFAAGTNI